MTHQFSEREQAYRDRVRRILVLALEQCATCEEGRGIDPAVRALDAVATLIQFSAMTAVMNEVHASDFLRLASAIFGAVDANRPPAGFPIPGQMH